MTDSQEHILVCVSSSPYNAKVIQAAGGLAAAFSCPLTALYVENSSGVKLQEADRDRLSANMSLAKSLGADIVTVIGDDVSYQISEYTRLSGITKIVIGHDAVVRKHFWNRSTLTESLISSVPDVDILIIPEASLGMEYRIQKRLFFRGVLPLFKDVLFTAAVIALTTLTAMLFGKLGFGTSGIITLFILAALIVSLLTKNYICGALASVSGGLIFNYMFVEPVDSLHVSGAGDPITLLLIIIASLTAGRLANKLAGQAKRASESAFFTKILFETNQMLTKADSSEEILSLTARQVIKLLDRPAVIFGVADGEPGESYMLMPEGSSDPSFTWEDEIVRWVCAEGCRAGFGTENYGDSGILYLPAGSGSGVMAVAGVRLDQTPLDAFEYSALVAIMGECAMTLENRHNLEEKENEARRAESERLRANILRTISHDLRTPLTSISGNARNLLLDEGMLDEETRRQMYRDMLEDSIWLRDMVENLLSVTRLGDGETVNIKFTAELVEDVVREAVSRVSRGLDGHTLTLDMPDEPVLARMSQSLISQVIINLVNNAVKYTQKDSVIGISVRTEDRFVYISVSDNGPGIPEANREKVFEMFYTGDSTVRDASRSMGLGLALCRSIIRAHGGEIVLTGNEPHGCVFTFSLPLYEVELNE